MVKHKIPADVRSLADRYFCEQCDRLGLPRPHAIKPIKAPRHAFRPRPSRENELEDARMEALIAKDREDGLAIERELMAAIAPGEPAPRMGLEAILRAYSDGENQ